MRPEMLYTINQYDPNRPDDPMTKAWDDTQSQVPFYKHRLFDDDDDNYRNKMLRDKFQI